MANNHNNNNKPRKNWFGQKRDQFGDNWLDRVSARDIQNNCLRILLDISRGNFDCYGKDIQDFCDPRVFTKIMEYTDKRVATFTEIVNGLNFLINNGLNNGNTHLVFDRCDMILGIYKNIKESLEAYCYCYDITIFLNMVQNIQHFKDYIDLNRALYG